MDMTPPYHIELASAHHVEQITAITSAEAMISTATASYQDEPLERWKRAYDEYSSSVPWLVAIDPSLSAGHDVIGYAKASPYNIRDGFRWSVELSVYVTPARKGLGVGVRLYEALFQVLKAQGYRRVYARIALPNPASQRLHERFGLKQTGRLPDFAWKFGQWYDMAIYTGSLDEPLTPQATLLAGAAEESSQRLLREVSFDSPPRELKTVEEAWTLLNDLEGRTNGDSARAESDSTRV